MKQLCQRSSRVFGFAASVMIALWLGVAFGRLQLAHRDFMQFLATHRDSFPDFQMGQPDRLVKMGGLVTVKSLLPFLKRPLRSDVRLYYISTPRCTTESEDAYATREEPTSWGWKSFC